MSLDAMIGAVVARRRRAAGAWPREVWLGSTREACVLGKLWDRLDWQAERWQSRAVPVLGAGPLQSLAVHGRVALAGRPALQPVAESGRGAGRVAGECTGRGGRLRTGHVVEAVG